jgi:hypothetical protein
LTQSGFCSSELVTVVSFLKFQTKDDHDKKTEILNLHDKRRQTGDSRMNADRLICVCSLSKEDIFGKGVNPVKWLREKGEEPYYFSARVIRGADSYVSCVSARAPTNQWLFRSIVIQKRIYA